MTSVHTLLTVVARKDGDNKKSCDYEEQRTRQLLKRLTRHKTSVTPQGGIINCYYITSTSAYHHID